MRGEESCDNCLYYTDKCNCKNSEMFGIKIPRPQRECCNSFVVWYREGYGDMGMRGKNNG